MAKSIAKAKPKKTTTRKMTSKPVVVAVTANAHFRDLRFLHLCPEARLSSGFWNGHVEDGVRCGADQLATIAGSSLFLWHAQTGELLERRDAGGRRAIRVSSAGDVIVVGPDSCVGGNLDLEVYRVGQRLDPVAKVALPLSSETAYSLDFAVRGAQLVVADSNQAWTVDLASKKVVHHFESPLAAQQSNGVAISPDGECVVFGQWQTNELSAHSTRDGRSLRRFPGQALHTGQGVRLAITSDAKRLLSAGAGAVRLWSLEDGQLLRALSLPPGSRDVLSLRLLPDDQRVLVRCPGVELICWNLSEQAATWVQPNLPLGAVPIPLEPGATEAGYGQGARLYRLRLESGERLGGFAGIDGPPSAVHLDPGAKTLCASGGGSTLFFDTATAQVRHRHSAHESSPAGKSVVLFQALSGFGTSVHLTRADGSNRLQVASGVFAAAVGLGDRVAIADGYFASGAKAVRIWSHRGAVEATVPCSGVERLLPFPDGRTLLASRKSELEVLDSDAGSSVAKIKKAHSRAVARMAVAPDGKLFATASTDVVRLWTLPGKPRCESKLGGAIGGLSFVDAKRLLVTLTTGELLVLDTAKARVLARFGLGKEVACSWLHPSGKLAVGFADLDVALFDLAGKL